MDKKKINNKKADERRSYSGELKAKVALEALRGDVTLDELARVLKINKALIASWKKRVVTQSHTLFEAKQIKPDNPRLERLKQEIS